MITKTEQFSTTQINKNLPGIKSGDTVKVHQKIKESFGKAQDKGEKERIQVFEGVVIAVKHGEGINATMTVRKVVDGIGVERIFPIHSPSISKVEVVRSAKVRRSKLYYLRSTKGKKARLKSKELAKAIVEKEPVIPEIVTETLPIDKPEVTE